MTGCEQCKHFRCYTGSRDKYGVPQEPDDYECVGDPDEKDLEKYFSDGVEWKDNEDGCSGFELRTDDDDPTGKEFDKYCDELMEKINDED